MTFRWERVGAYRSRDSTLTVAGVGDVRFWTFNVADSAVTVGALMLAFVLWREDRRELAVRAAEAAARDDVPPTVEAPIVDAPIVQTPIGESKGERL
jgi:hypothetical protein